MRFLKMITKDILVLKCITKDVQCIPHLVLHFKDYIKTKTLRSTQRYVQENRVTQISFLIIVCFYFKKTIICHVYVVKNEDEVFQGFALYVKCQKKRKRNSFKRFKSLK